MQNKQNEWTESLNAAPLLKNLVDNKAELSAFRQAVQKDWLKLYQESFVWEPYRAFDWSMVPELKEDSRIVVGYFAGEAKWAECRKFPLPQENWIGTYPRIEHDRLIFGQCQYEDLVLSPNWGVLEAPQDTENFKPTFIFVPASACDLKGNRIGKGGGFYDRYIDNHPECITCTVIHSRYLFEQLPKKWFHTGDRKTQYILTEKNFINIKESSL